MLANILRRPIIVVCDTILHGVSGFTIAQNNLCGVYLPLLSAAEDCVKSPVVVGYHSSHFIALVHLDDKRTDKKKAIPLSDHHLHQYPVHFLLEGENGELLIKQYMDQASITYKNQEETLTIVAVNSPCHKISPELCVFDAAFSLMQEKFAEKACEMMSELTMSSLEPLCAKTYCCNNKISESTSCPQCIGNELCSTHSLVDTKPSIGDTSLTQHKCGNLSCQHSASATNMMPHCHCIPKHKSIAIQVDQTELEKVMLDKATETTAPPKICSRSACDEVVEDTSVDDRCAKCYVLNLEDSLEEGFVNTSPERKNCKTVNCIGTSRKTSKSGLCSKCKIDRAAQKSCIRSSCNRPRGTNSEGLCRVCITNKRHPPNRAESAEMERRRKETEQRFNFPQIKRSTINSKYSYCTMMYK